MMVILNLHMQYWLQIGLPAHLPWPHMRPLRKLYAVQHGLALPVGH